MLCRFNRIGWPMAAAVALAATGAATPAVAPAQTAASRMIELDTNQGRLITLPRPITDVFVANPAIADIQVRSPTQIYLVAKSTGQTTVSATTKGGAIVFAATVRVGDNFASIGQMLKMAMPEANIAAHTMNGVVLLTGTVMNPADGQEASSLVQAFVGDKTRVISRLRTATPLQVNLQVKFAEVSKTFAKNIGANIQTRDTTGGFNFGVASGRNIGTIGPVDTSALPKLDASSKFGLPAGSISLPFDPKTGDFVYPNSGTAYNMSNLAGTARTALGFAGKAFGLDILSALDLGETDGQVTTLAQPNLSALSGETGTFLAGGEIPIPISQGLGAVSVEYKQYGVSLAFTPTVLSDGRISLRVRPEVSQLSNAGAVSFGGTIIPALTTRRAETTVELGSGQSMVIGGLLQNSTNNQIDKAPGLGDVPVLGALFRSTAWQRNESELVIVITPYLVKPVNANDIVLPTDGYKAPTDAGRVLLGQLGSGTTGLDRPKPTMAAPVTAPAFGANAPVPAAPGAPAPSSDTKRDESKALPPKKSKKGADTGAAPGFSL
jgi:pilus assembly protein CpaC